jgi:hypothetical protein
MPKERDLFTDGAHRGGATFDVSNAGDTSEGSVASSGSSHGGTNNQGGTKSATASAGSLPVRTVSAGGDMNTNHEATGGNTSIGRLLAHFPFDEQTGKTVDNRVDPQKPGTYVGDCTHPSGRLDGAVAIRNISGETVTTEWVELPADLLSALAEATLSIWVRDLSTARDGGRLFQFSSSEGEEVYFSPDAVNSETKVTGSHLGGTHNGTTFVDLWAASPALTDKFWHHIAVTWSRASIDLYVDGKLKGSKNSPRALPSDFGATSMNWLGRTRNDATISLYAEFDDLRIYGRVLSAQEVQNLYSMN